MAACIPEDTPVQIKRQLLAQLQHKVLPQDPSYSLVNEVPPPDSVPTHLCAWDSGCAGPPVSGISHGASREHLRSVQSHRIRVRPPYFFLLRFLISTVHPSLSWEGLMGLCCRRSLCRCDRL